MAEEAIRSSSALEEIQRTFFGYVHETVRLKDELKKSQVKISELEKQLEASNETIRMQQVQLLEAADIMKEVQIFEKKSNETIGQLKKQLDEKRKEELNQKVSMVTENGLHCKSNSQCNNSVEIITLDDATPNNKQTCNNGPTAELQQITANLHKNVNEFKIEEKKQERYKALSKIIDETTNLVGCISSVIGGEIKNKIGSIATPPTIFEGHQKDVVITTPQEPSSSATSTNSDGHLPTTSKHGKDLTRKLHCVCGHKSTNKGALIRHITAKCRGKPFRCARCDHRARDTTDLNLHYRRVHQVNTSYANGCAGCGKMYDTRQNLLRHKYIDQCNNLPRGHD